MLRYADGDARAFGELYDELAPSILRFLFRGVRERSIAEDLTQQTFLAIHRARGSFDQEASVRPWAYAIARRLMLDTMRAKKRRPEHELTEADAVYALTNPETSTLARFEAVTLMKKLRTLPDIYREAFELVRLEGLSMSEAAEAAGCSVAAMKLRAHRAYEQLGLGEESARSRIGCERGGGGA